MIGDIIISLTYNVMYDTSAKTLHLENNHVSAEIVSIEIFMDYQVSVSKTGTVYVTPPPLLFTAIENM